MKGNNMYARSEAKVRLLGDHNGGNELEQVRVRTDTGFARLRRESQVHPQSGEEDDVLDDESGQGVVEEASTERSGVIRSDLGV